MKKIRRALYTGTFDPFTKGHQYILMRALELFDEITILVAIPPTKKPFFSLETRMEMLGELFIKYPQVKIDCWPGLVVDYARKHKIGAIVRGLRPTGDFEVEFQMASVNRQLNSDLETVFLMTGESHYYISSSIVKEIFTHDGDVSEFVPEEIFKKMLKLREERENEKK